MTAALPARLLLTLPLLLAAACEKGGATLAELPPLLESTPADGALNVPVTSWIVLEFTEKAGRPMPGLFDLACGASYRPTRAYFIGGARIVVVPRDPLPPAADCTLAWPSTLGDVQVQFATAAPGMPFEVVHDRTDPTRIAPYPDDVHLAADPTTDTGWRHDVAVPTQTVNHEVVFSALLAEANQLDGFSPIGPIVIEVGGRTDPASVPLTPAEALDPTASIVLLDLTPWSAGFGRRVPFRTDVRNDVTGFGLRSRTLLLFPSIPLEPGGRYALYVTTRVHTLTRRPLGPSPYFAAVLGEPVAGEDPAVARNRELLADVLEAGQKVLSPPLPAEQLAYAARISIRTTDPIQEEVQAMKAWVLANDPPAVTIDPSDPNAVEATPADHVAALVRGTWDAPDWRDGVGLARDAQGRPVVTGTRPACFRLALPEAALDGPVPVVLYQHGNPGSSETEVLSNARRFLAEAGYAVIGFTDILNREAAPPSGSPGPACIGYESPTRSDEDRLTTQIFDIVLDLLANQKISDHWQQTLGEQLAFVRMIEGLADLDLLPLGAPDGVPDLDPSRLLYMGISEGGNNGQAFVAYAPEVRAAALMVGGARLIEVLIHQQASTFLNSLPVIFPTLSPAEIWTAASIFQADFDRQDKHNHGRFVFRQPAAIPLACEDAETCLAEDYCEVPGRCTTRKPSVLLVEGLDDSLVPNHATDSAAWQMGPIPHLKPLHRVVPFLDTAWRSVSGNVDEHTTAAFYQYVPVGTPDAPATPGCQSPPLSTTSSQEGHYCAQSAVESRAQRLIFFDTALDPARDAPVIVDPLPLYPEGTPLFPLPDTTPFP